MALSIISLPEKVKGYSSFKMLLNSLIILITYLITLQFTYSQGGPSGPVPTVRNEIIPPAPTAASLGKFIDSPVSLYTGSPRITIPIWEINSGSIRLPVALNYATGGIKVEEISSWVGLGWSLDAGGVITRSVRGLPDDGVSGYWDTISNTDFPTTASYSSQQYSKFLSFAMGDADSQPDLFYFNFSGYSGKFVRDRSGRIITIPYQNIKITSNSTNTSWTVLTENGTRYIFSDAERSNTSSVTVTGLSTRSSPIRPDYSSSWFLSEIISPGNDRITFEYTDYSLPTYDLPSSETKYTRKSMSTTASNEVTSKRDEFNYLATSLNKGKRLRKIIFATGEIEFYTGPTRCDLRGDAVLSSIIVRQNTPVRRDIREFFLKQGYLTGNYINSLESLQCPPGRDVTGESLAYRLMLLSVTERSGVTSKPPYRFSYITNEPSAGVGLPHRMQNRYGGSGGPSSYYSQDHWGYFNNRDNGTTLIPAQRYSGVLMPGQGTQLPDGTYWLAGADRSSSLRFAQLGSLYKITYPTGGSTEFEWQLHSFQPIASYANEVTLAPATVARTWRYFTYPPGSGNQPAPIIINNPPAPITMVKITIDRSFPCSCLPNTPTYYNACYSDCRVWFKIRDKATNAEKFVFSAIDSYSPPDLTFSVFLPSGEYYLEAYHNIKLVGPNGQTQTAPDPARPYGITLTWTEPEGSTNQADYLVGGGLRVAKVTTLDPVTSQYLIKQYKYENSMGESSGKLVSFPSYGYNFTESVSLNGLACTGYPNLFHLYQNDFFVRSSTSLAPLGVTQGSIVGYKYITEYNSVLGENLGSRGKTEYTYTSPSDYEDDSPRLASFPFAPANSRDWQRGLLIAKTDYRRDGITYLPSKKINHEYNFYNENTVSNPNVAGQNAIGVLVGFTHQQYVSGCMGPTDFDIRNFSAAPLAYRFFNTSTGYTQLASTATTLYDAQGASKPFETLTTYAYDLHHLQVVEEIQQTSNANTLRTIYRYPDNLVTGSSGGTPEIAALRQLQNTHRTNVLIEKQQWLLHKDASSWQLVSGTLTKFKEITAVPGSTHSSFVVPAEDHVFETAVPLSETQVQPTAVANGQLIVAPQYRKRETFDAYTPTGQLLQRTQLPQQATVYLWGYLQQYPVAEVNNATYAQVESILGASVLSRLASLTPGTDAQVRALLQPLRTQLPQAQTTVYTHDPLIGMTSQTGPDGRTVFYEYDALGRLLRVRDEQNRILSEQEYRYGL